MTTTFEKVTETTWKAFVNGIAIYINAQGDRAQASDLSPAYWVAENLSAVGAQGAAYLDEFVDRRKATSRDNEEWHLEEIEIRSAPHVEARCCLFYTLYGDGDGQWTVEMRILQDRAHPIRLERKQG